MAQVAVRFLGFASFARVVALFLRQWLSLPVSMISKLWVRRSSKAVVIVGSPNTVAHAKVLWLVVTIRLVRS